MRYTIRPLDASTWAARMPRSSSTRTAYADLTGEVLFIRNTIGDCHADSVRTGARITHSCGFDSDTL